VRALIYEDANINKEDLKGRSPISLSSRFNAIPRESILKMAEDGVQYRKKRHLEDPATKAGIIQAIALFANKPKKALDLLASLNVVSDAPEDRARFLMNNRKKLDKVQLGELLSDAEQKELLMAFVNMQDFRGLKVTHTTSSACTHARTHHIIDHRCAIEAYFHSPLGLPYSWMTDCASSSISSVFQARLNVSIA